MMRVRSKVNRRKDHKIFSRTAAHTNPLNVPGKIVQRGGTRL